MELTCKITKRISRPSSYKADRSCLNAQITQFIMVLNWSAGTENKAMS